MGRGRAKEPRQIPGHRRGANGICGGAGRRVDVTQTAVAGRWGQVREASIYIDSQAVLKVLHSNKPVPRHQLADTIHRAYDRVLQKHPTTCITFRWITAHKDCS